MITRVTQGQVRERLKALPLAEAFSRVQMEAKSIPGLVYLVLDVTPESAFSDFPITLYTFDGSLAELDCSLNATELIPNCTLLDPRNSYPIGRADIAGLDTTPEWRMLLDEICTYVAKSWNIDESGDGLPQVLVGNVRADELEHVMLPSQLINLRSGTIETHCFTWNP